MFPKLIPVNIFRKCSGLTSLGEAQPLQIVKICFNRSLISSRSDLLQIPRGKSSLVIVRDPKVRCWLERRGERHVQLPAAVSLHQESPPSMSRNDDNCTKTFVILLIRFKRKILKLLSKRRFSAAWCVLVFFFPSYVARLSFQLSTELTEL